MSKQLHKFFTNILAMPHYANEAAGSGQKHNKHEDAIADELVKIGYREVPKFSNSAKLKPLLDIEDSQEQILEIASTVNPGEFISQPCGSQSPPDFLIRDFTGYFVFVEGKSGKGACPAWNDNLPKTNMIYILSSGTHNASTIFFGRDVIDEQRKEILLNAHAETRKIIKKTSKKLESTPDPYNRGFGYYARPKFEQGGGKAKGDYFTHPNRKQCEDNVLNFVIKI